MKSLFIVVFIMSTGAWANDPHNNSGYNNRSIVRCSSINNHRQTCNADTSGGVQLIKQLSRSSCHDNWGYSRNQIWVDNGCRAKFQLYVGNNGNHNNSRSNSHNNGGNANSHNNNNRYNNNTHNNNNNSHGNNNAHSNNSNGHNSQSFGNRVVCESINSRRNSCSIPHGVSVSLYKQLSHSSCDHNWGYNDSQIWVTNGCRAEFTINNSH